MRGRESPGSCHVVREDEAVEITEFLLARIAEDEQAARAATAGPWEVRPYWFTSGDRSWSAVPEVIDEDIDAHDAEHIARWDPARVLAECETKRQVVGRAQLLDEQAASIDPADVRLRASFEGQAVAWAVAVMMLALPYADHPDYRPEWKV